MEPENIGQINRRALFCDENGDFRIPPEPEQNDQVKIKFRTGKNDVDAVFYIQEGGERKVSLKKIESDKRFDYYECLITVSAEPIRYWFHIEKGEDSCYYHRLGAVEEIEPSFAFQITPGFHTPDWAKGADITMAIPPMMCRIVSIFISDVRCATFRSGPAIRMLWMWDIFMAGICKAFGTSLIIFRSWEWKYFILIRYLCLRQIISMILRIMTTLILIMERL